MRLALSAVTRGIAQRRVLAASSSTRSGGPATTTATRRGVTTHSQLSSEHSMVYEMCRKFADEELTPNASKWDKDHSFPTEAVNKLVRVVVVVCNNYSCVNCVLLTETTRVGVGERRGGREEEEGDDFKASRHYLPYSSAHHLIIFTRLFRYVPTIGYMYNKFYELHDDKKNINYVGRTRYDGDQLFRRT